MELGVIVLWCVGIYLALGAATTWLLSQTPYADNGWIVTTLLWPLFLWALFFR